MNISKVNNLSFKSVYCENGPDLKPFEYRDVIEAVSKETGFDYYVKESHIFHELHPCYEIHVKSPKTNKTIDSVKIDPDLLGWDDDVEYIRKTVLRV